METSLNMKGRSKLRNESKGKIGSGCRRRKGLMHSDGSELREDDPQASAVAAYLKLIIDTLAGLAGGEYNNFLKVMGDFKVGRIDTEDVENQLKDIFHGHPELLLELNRFLPNDNDIILSAESDEADQLITKQQASLPSLLTDIHKKERLSRQCLNQGKLVEDPLSDEQKRKTLNPWTPEEKQLFLEKFKLFRKLFSKIASFLENKTTDDCVEYYYLNKKSEDFGKVLRRRREFQRT